MKKPEKIVITGATGFVGNLLVQRLLDADCKLLLVGRSVERIQANFPNVPSCTYDDLAEKGKDFDLLVHLAVINSDQRSSEQDVRQVNVGLALDVAKSAAAAGIPRLLNLSSTHALNENLNTAYAISKRESAEKLSALEGIQVHTVVLPLVYGERWSGKMSRLNALPRPIARKLFSFFSAMKPTCHIDKLTKHILANAPDEPKILSDRQTGNPVYGAIMRIIDLVFAFAVVGLLGWLLLIVWIAVKLGSPGPGIFKQTRVGRNGAHFVCYKFRTMKEGTPQAGTHSVSAAAVTPLGNILRKTKLDELPQVINIFRNEIGLIGPRPCLPVQKELIRERSQRGVLDLKPGISGLAQINGVDMSNPEKLALWDARYAALRSITLDVKIAFLTFAGKGQGDNTKSVS